MSNTLKAKAAIVTGASRGIGRSIAVKLASQGASVVVNFARDAEAAEAVVAEIQAAGGTSVAVQADVRRTPEIVSLFDATESTYGSVDILVNNAGILRSTPVADVSEAEFDDGFGINVRGLFFACREAARRMSDNGRIINLSSAVTRMMIPGYSVYTAGKGAVDQITRVLAKELGPRGITVNAVAPGPTMTDLFKAGKSDDQIQAMAQMTPLGRIGRPADIADAVALLVSEDARWITGQHIGVNGGIVA